MGLTRKQKAAIDALATTTTKTEAAEKAGCAVRSIYGWLKQPEFKNALLARERQLRNDAARLAGIYAVEALELLHDIFTNKRHDVSVRRLAAKDLLNYLNQTETQMDIEIRLTQLEAKNENNK
jgi:phage terminase small subunit